jgi:HEAT repeat protein
MRLFLLVLVLAACLGLAWYFYLDAGSAKDKRAPPDLVEQLQDTDHVTRYEAAIALGKQGPDAEKAIPALVKAMGNSDRGAAKEMSKALAKIGDKAIPALIEILRSADAKPGQQMYALDALRQMGPGAAKQAKPELIALLKPDGKNGGFIHRHLAGRAVVILGEIGPDAKDALPDLFDAAKKPSPLPSTDDEICRKR